MRFYHLATFALALTASSMAFAQNSRDLTVEQTTAAQAGKPKPGTLRVNGSVDRQDLTYAVGENVRLFVQANEASYITIVNVGPKGHVTQLFPNAFQKNNRVKANQKVEIPAAKSGSRITVTGPVGAELIKIFASSDPVKVIAESQLEGKGAFRSVKGGIDALVRNLEVISDTAPPAQKFAIHNLIVKTIASRIKPAAVNPSFIVVPGKPSQSAAPKPPTPVAAPASVGSPSPTAVVPNTPPSGSAHGPSTPTSTQPTSAPLTVLTPAGSGAAAAPAATTPKPPVPATANAPASASPSLPVPTVATANPGPNDATPAKPEVTPTQSASQSPAASSPAGPSTAPDSASSIPAASPATSTPPTATVSTAKPEAAAPISASPPANTTKPTPPAVGSATQ